MTANPSRKKLIEIGLPLAEINAQSVREKSIRHGHPSTMHLWWARRPLAACRAVLFAQLVDDPSACIDEFPTQEAQDAERARLHDLIGRLVPWEASNDAAILSEARLEIAKSVARSRGDGLESLRGRSPDEIVAYLQASAPPVFDPFAGGGSIALEAQRLGLRVVASDLNPVAVLISKALVEFPPRFAGRTPLSPGVKHGDRWRGAEGLAADLLHYGRWMREEAAKSLIELYPKAKLGDGGVATVIAWLWVRTIPSPDPRAGGAHIPLASSFVVSAKKGTEVIVKPVVDHRVMQWRFEIDTAPDAAALQNAKRGTVDRNGGVCLLTGRAMPFSYIRSEGKAGRMSRRLMAIVAAGERGPIFLPPTDEHANAADVPCPDVPELESRLPENPRDFKTPNYGLPRWKDLFTARQLTALTTFADLIAKVREKVLADAQANAAVPADTRPLCEGGSGAVAYADAVATYLALAVGRCANYWSSQAAWGGSFIVQSFGRQALPMVWDFAEANPFSQATGNWLGAVDWVDRALRQLPAQGEAQVALVDAQAGNTPPGALVSTDPPYYDNIAYADLSDHFYAWHRRMLSGIHPELYRAQQTPKSEELIALPYRARARPADVTAEQWSESGAKGRADLFFRDGMRRALAQLATGEAQEPLSLYYGFKQSRTRDGGVTSLGWSTFLQALIDAGLTIGATWTVRTERDQGLKSANNALSSSIVLVCRRRDKAATAVSRQNFERAVRGEMPAWIAEFSNAGVPPTDLQQSLIGRGVGLFSRYARVTNDAGTPLAVAEALSLIARVREEIETQSDATFDSATRTALDWFAAHGFANGAAAALNDSINIDRNRFATVFQARGATARLLKRDELAADSSGHESTWAACQHLIRHLLADEGGIEQAAALYNRLGTHAESAHALARRLYDICEQRQWAAEGYAYNRLHQDWGAITRRAAELRGETRGGAGRSPRL